KINKKEFKIKSNALARDAKQILTQKGSRAAMIAAFVFIAAAFGTGLIAAYLTANLLVYFGVEPSDPGLLAIIAAFIFALTPPAVGGMRHVASAVCDGREVSLSEIFIAFSSFERLLSSYLCALLTCLRWGVIVALIYSPDIIDAAFGLEAPNGEPSRFMFPAIVLAFALAVLCIMLTRKLSRVSHFVWSGKMSFFRALGESVKRKHLSRLLTGDDLLGALISLATCFTYFLFAAGPLYAVKYELYSRREQELIDEIKIVKSRKDGQKK
ncbi:MAG: hypothetical protein ACI3XI_09140, partial [Eubacteriales bacterium]